MMNLSESAIELFSAIEIDGTLAAAVRAMSRKLMSEEFGVTPLGELVNAGLLYSPFPSTGRKALKYCSTGAYSLVPTRIVISGAR